MGKKFKGYCYYCGAKATSFEHAPPRQMFRGFSCDSITVPSCDEHNTKKSGDDQAIISAFLLPLLNGKDLYQLEPEIEYAIKLAMPSFERAKKKTMSMQLLNDPLLGLPNISYLSADAKFWQWIRQLTAALVFDATKLFVNIAWDDTIAWSPHRIQSQKNEPMELSKVINDLSAKDVIKKEFEELNWLEG